MCMRLHITMPRELVRDLDKVAGKRGRSDFIRKAVAKEVEWERRWQHFEKAFGSFKGKKHEWDDDPAAWVRKQRRSIHPRRRG